MQATTCLSDDAHTDIHTNTQMPMVELVRVIHCDNVIAVIDMWLQLQNAESQPTSAARAPRKFAAATDKCTEQPQTTPTPTPATTSHRHACPSTVQWSAHSRDRQIQLSLSKLTGVLVATAGHGALNRHCDTLPHCCAHGPALRCTATGGTSPRSHSQLHAPLKAQVCLARPQLL
jgi:hypothetical protein